MFEKVFLYAGPHKRGLYAATGIVLLSVLCGVLPFVLAYQIIEPLVSGSTVTTELVTSRAAGVLLCLVAQALLYGWGLNVSHNAAYGTLLRLRTSLQKKFENLPLGVIQDKGTGTVKKLFVDDVDSLEVLLAHSLPEGVANLMIPVTVILALFVVDWKLALLSLASIPLSLWAMKTMYAVGMQKMGPYYAAGQKMNNTIIEYVNGMEVVKVFNRDADSYARLRDDVLAYRDYTLAWYKAAWPWMAMYSSLLPCTIILTLPVGSWFVLHGWSTLADLILTLCLALSIGTPLLKSLSFLPTLPQLNYKIAALEQVLEAAPLAQTEDEFHGVDDSVRFAHVSFAYYKTVPGPDGQPQMVSEPVLQDISFTARAEEKTALVGESGSGKSTLAKLLVHYYDVADGAITIGGQDLREMSLAALNSHISYVAQDQYLFNTSLLENIRLGRPDATEDEVFAAADKAQCTEFLARLPQGIHTPAGDAGKMLSGGQRIAETCAVLMPRCAHKADISAVEPEACIRLESDSATAEVYRHRVTTGQRSGDAVQIRVRHAVPQVDVFNVEHGHSLAALHGGGLLPDTLDGKQNLGAVGRIFTGSFHRDGGTVQVVRHLRRHAQGGCTVVTVRCCLNN